MPNGGVDNCSECPFAAKREPSGVRCNIRGLDIDDPHWTYCANHPKHNPSLVTTPVGPVYQDSGEYPYRRVVLDSSVADDDVRSRVELLERVVSGDLGSTSWEFRVGLIQDLGELEAKEAIGLLVDLAVADSGDMKLVPNPSPPGTIDLGDQWASDAARVEFIRWAANRALRKICLAKGDGDAREVLRERFQTGGPELRMRALVTMAFISSYIEPP